MRTTYVMRRGRLMPKRLAAPLITADDPRMYVIGDVMEPAKHMATGKIHDSKSAFRAETRALGLTEAGSDSSIRRPQPRRYTSQAEVVQDVKRAIQELNSR